MGYGAYSYDAHVAMTSARKSKPREQVFTQRTCHPQMNPMGLGKRECRDSADHPNSLGIIFALDVSGSMGEIPGRLASHTLPEFMAVLGDAGVADPQVLFMAIGHPDSDRAPLQVGQFESTAKLMDQWLTWMFLEGGGAGGNETYELAMYVAARHTAMDCLEKRGRKGYLFMTGDEPPNPGVSAAHVGKTIGAGLQADLPLDQMIAEVSAGFEPFFLIPDTSRDARVGPAWRERMGVRVIGMGSPDDTSHVAAGLVALTEGAVADLPALIERFKAVGLPRERLASIAQALTPYAASIGRAGTPDPALTDAGLPAGDAPSGMDRH